MGNKKTKCPDKSFEYVKAKTTAKKGETRLMGNGLSPINRVPARWEKICNFIEREIYYSRAKFSSPINPDRLIRGLLSPLI